MGDGNGSGLETLGVDPDELARYGGELVAAAGDIPAAPASFTTSGTDAISMKIMSSLPFVEAPILTGLPEVKGAATDTATKIVDAAAKYAQTDEQLAKLYEQYQFETAGGAPGGGAPGGVPGSGAPGSAASPAASPAGGMDQMGQMMGMAGQAAQLPMQAMGMVAAVPQGIMQGVSSAMQQVSQLAGGIGGGDDASLGELEKSDESDESSRRTEELTKDADEKDGAAAGQPDSERAPVEPPAAAAPPAPEKLPAQTRPAEVADEMNL